MVGNTGTNPIAGQQPAAPEAPNTPATPAE